MCDGSQFAVGTKGHTRPNSVNLSEGLMLSGLNHLTLSLAACRESPYQGMVFYEDGDV